MMTVLGLITSALWAGGGPHGCASFFVNSDVDSVREVGRSWLPPRVDCQFTFHQEVWIEPQLQWWYLLPVSFLLGAAWCAWYAVRHPTPNPTAAVRYRVNSSV